jgi:hypothetical protein
MVWRIATSKHLGTSPGEIEGAWSARQVAEAHAVLDWFDDDAIHTANYRHRKRPARKGR